MRVVNLGTEVFLGNLLRLCCALCSVCGVAHAQSVVMLPVPASRLTYDSVNKKIYATVGSGGRGEMANSVTIIDPIKGIVEGSFAIGNEPRDVVVSDGAKYLYVVLNDGSSIRRFDLATRTAGVTFPVGEGVAAVRILPMPGVPEGVVVERNRRGRFPNNAGLVLYVNGLPKPQTTDPGHQLAAGISPSRVFGYENMISSWGFTAINLTKEGPEGDGTHGSVLSGNVGFATSLNGLIISDRGGVIDPEARQSLGNLPDIKDNIAGHKPSGQVFSLSGSDGKYTLRSADLSMLSAGNTYDFAVPGATGGVSNFIIVGERTGAFCTGKAVVLFRTNFGAKLPEVDLSVARSPFPAKIARGSEFSYTLTVTNNAKTAPSSKTVLTDQLPGGVEPVTVVTSQGDAIGSGQIVRADLGAVAPGGSATVTVTLRVKATENLRFAAVVRAREPDPDTENNIERPALKGVFKLADLSAEWGGLQQVSEGTGVDLRNALVGSLLIRNTGNQSSEPCTVRFYAGTGPNFVPTSYILLQQMEIPAIKPGKSFTAVLEAPLGYRGDATGMYIFGQVDPKNTVEESTKDNNVARTKVL